METWWPATDHCSSPMNTALDLSGVRTILLDAVGTLIYPEPAAPVVYHQIGRQFGSELSAEEVARRFQSVFKVHDEADHQGGLERCSTDERRERARWRSIVADVFTGEVTGGNDLFEALWTHFSNPGHWRVYDDVRATWNALDQRGYTLGIASNFDSRLARICRALEPLDECQHIYCSADIGYLKPSRRFFAEVRRRMGAASDELLLVGDALENDYQGAKSAGWHAILLDRGNKRQVSQSISDLSQLLGFLSIRLDHGDTEATVKKEEWG